MFYFSVVFRVYDIDRDGYISKDDLIHVSSHCQLMANVLICNLDPTLSCGCINC